METTSPQPPLPFKDRKNGLIIFGVLTILMGGACALFVPLMLYGASVSSKAAAGTANLRMILPTVITYGLLAIALIWLGVGSILLKRWARALLLVFSWAWLLVGIISIGSCAFVLPQSMAKLNTTQAPAAVTMVVTIFILAIMGVIFFVLPLCWVLFYRSRHVKATCEASNPSMSWTDKCPLPVLALSLMMAIGAPMLLAMPFSNNGMFPCFGIFLSGWSGTALYWLLAVCWVYVARESYKLRLRAWWMALLLMIFFAISAFITYSLHNVADVYRRMGLPEDQIARIQEMPWMQGQGIAWMTLASSALMIGYVLFTRRYFRGRKPPAEGGHSASPEV